MTKEHESDELPSEILGHEIEHKSVGRKSVARVYVITDPENRHFYYINPGEWSWDNHVDRKTGKVTYKPRGSEGGLICLWFDQHAPTRVLVWASGYEDALEKSAEFLADHLPGNLTDLKEESDEARKELRGELGREPTDEEVWEAAEVDMTYTESGWIRSDDWGDFYNRDTVPGKLIEVAQTIGDFVEPADID